MKRLFFCIWLLLTFYLAGMYRSLPLLTLCGTELALAVVLLILPRYFVRRLTLTFQKANDFAEVQADIPCGLLAVYSGRLPPTRFTARLEARYPAARQRTVCRLHGGAAQGAEQHHVHLRFPYCGLVELQITRVRVYDYLSLFSARKKAAEKMRVFVLPGAQALRFAHTAFDGSNGQAAETQSVDKNGSAQQEIRQLREYRVGDTSRHIHWNMSARTGGLWIKEFAQETDSRAQIFLKLNGYAAASVQRRSSFYTLLSALVLGLLENTVSVQVCWYDTTGFCTQEVTNAEDCHRLLCALYCLSPAQTAGEAPPEQCFRLDLQLALFWGETPLHAFSEKTLAQDIAESIFTF